jgi:uncharacterized protein (TIGR01244 family)
MVRHFRVNDEISVGRDQPGEAELREIAAAGFRAILDLRPDGEGVQPLPPAAEARAAEAAGLRYRNLAIPADRLDEAMLDRFDALLRELPKPVFVHCASGKRSGSFALACAAIGAGLSGDKVIERIAEAGAAYGSEEMRQTIRRWVDRRGRAAGTTR